MYPKKKDNLKEKIKRCFVTGSGGGGGGGDGSGVKEELVWWTRNNPFFSLNKSFEKNFPEAISWGSFLYT